MKSCKYIFIAFGLFFANSAFANLRCNIDLYEGQSFELFLIEAPVASGKSTMTAPTIGLMGHCIESGFDLICYSNRGDNIEIDTRSNQVRWENGTGQLSRGSAECRVYN